LTTTEIRVIEDTEQLSFRPAVRKAFTGQPDTGDAQEGEHELKQRSQLLDPSSEHQDFLAEFQLRQISHIEAHDGGRDCAEPSSSGRPRDAASGGNGQVAGVLNEFAQPVVVALLRTGRGHTPIVCFAAAGSQLRWPALAADNSRGRVQNVVADGSVLGSEEPSVCRSAK
jgi:hypothetical protein